MLYVCEGYQHTLKKKKITSESYQVNTSLNLTLSKTQLINNYTHTPQTEIPCHKLQLNPHLRSLPIWPTNSSIVIPCAISNTELFHKVKAEKCNWILHSMVKMKDQKRAIQIPCAWDLDWPCIQLFQTHHFFIFSSFFSHKRMLKNCWLTDSSNLSGKFATQVRSEDSNTVEGVF